MKLGIGSYAYAWAIGNANQTPPHPMTQFDLVQRAADLGVHLVQICDNLPLHKLSETELGRLQAHAKRLGVDIEVGTRGIDEAHLRTYLQLAKRFGSPILRVVAGAAHAEPTANQVVQAIRGLLPDLQAERIILAIENHDRFTSRTLAEVFDRLSSPYVGLCLDTVNSFGCLEGPEAVVVRLAKYVVNLHIKDFKIGRTPSTLGFLLQGTPAGEGQLNVPWLLGELRKAKREVNAILETWPAPEETVEQTIAKEDAWVAQSIRYLRTLIAE
jgi:sugar phosphate isomerase/epimerase